MEAFLTPEFWIAVGQIVMIDILLGGDNAVVIALACRNLPADLRKRGIIWGTVGAILLRVVLIFFAMSLLALPYLKLLGALLLLWIGAKLMVPQDDTHDIPASNRLLDAVRTIIVADLVMSVDNVIGIAGAAQGSGHEGNQMPLVMFGLLVSIPIIVWGSTLVLKLMDRFPLIITIGAMLLGWIAGTLGISDPAVAPYVPQTDVNRYMAGVAGALFVLGVGTIWAKRQQANAAP